MRFSILRLLIVTGMVAVWVGMVRFMIQQSLYDHQSRPDGEQIFFGVVGGSVLAAIAVSAVFGLWLLAGEMERALRDEGKPPPTEDEPPEPTP